MKSHVVEEAYRSFFVSIEEKTYNCTVAYPAVVDGPGIDTGALPPPKPPSPFGQTDR